MDDEIKTDADAAVAAAEKVDADAANETLAAPTLMTVTGSLTFTFSDSSTQVMNITGAPAS